MFHKRIKLLGVGGKGSLMEETALKNILEAVNRENAKKMCTLSHEKLSRGLHGTIFLLQSAFTASLQPK